MKTFINRFRWLYAGIWIGFGIAAWVMGNEEQQNNEINKKFNDIVNPNTNKETANA